MGSQEPETRPALSIDELGMTPPAREAFERIVLSPFGILLIGGPPDSGRSTTLAAALRFLVERGRRAAVLERPVSASRRQLVPLKKGTQKGRGDLIRRIKSPLPFLRDPGTVTAGEIGDEETAEAAIHAALTGRLVLGKIIAGDAPSAILRLAGLGIPPFLISSALAGVVAQRLVSRICEGCRAAARQAGCPACGGTGFRGHTALFEVLPIDDALRSLIGGGATAGLLRREARRRGIPAIGDDGASKALRGITTVEEVRRASERPLP